MLPHGLRACLIALTLLLEERACRFRGLDNVDVPQKWVLAVELEACGGWGDGVNNERGDGFEFVVPGQDKGVDECVHYWAF